MYLKKIYSILILTIFFVIIFSGTASATDTSKTTTVMAGSQATTSNSIYVSPTGNDNNPGTQDYPYKTINKGINSVTDGGTVYLANGTYAGVDNINITIVKNLNIIGQSGTGTIINAQNRGFIFKITNGITVNIKNLNFINANNTDYGIEGGAIHNEGTLTITNSNFRGNNVWLGVIYNIGDTTLISDNFNNNTGSAIWNENKLTVNSCNFTSNSGGCDDGVIVNNGNMNIQGCNFTNNTGNNGGAITNFNNLTLNNCTFTSNTANGTGGGICNLGNLNISNSTFTINNSQGTIGLGGAIYNNKIMTITGTTFTSNKANRGGAIFNDIDANSNITSSTFKNNKATNMGGAIYNDGIAILRFNRLVGNTASIGTAIYDADNGTVDAKLNWWGTNFNIPFVTIITPNLVYGNVNITPWLVLTININPGNINIKKGETSTVTVDLQHDSNGNYYSPTVGHVPDGLTVNLTGKFYWNLFPSTGIPVYIWLQPLTMVNGTVKLILQASLVPGREDITAKVDNQTVYYSVGMGD